MFLVSVLYLRLSYASIDKLIARSYVSVLYLRLQMLLGETVEEAMESFCPLFEISLRKVRFQKTSLKICFCPLFEILSADKLEDCEFVSEFLSSI